MTMFDALTRGMNCDEAMAAILKGMCDAVANEVGKTEEKPVEPEKPATDKLYRVQVGAFAVRENAERMLRRLKRRKPISSRWRIPRMTKIQMRMSSFRLM